MDEIKVNDGKGFFDYSGLIDTLLTDCNGIVQHMAAGQYVQFCLRIGGMAQKLVQLKDGIRNDLEDREKQIADLKRCNNELVQQLVGLEVEDGEGNAP